MPFQRTDEGATSTFFCEGKSAADVFIDAAHGLFDVVAGGSKVRGDQREEIVIQADDLNGLFAGWLTELLSRVTDKGMLYSDFEVFSIQKAGSKQFVLTGTIYGEPHDAGRHTVARATLDRHSASCTEKTGSAACRFIVKRSQ